jgi:4-hydroxy-tetrahydrodipicolinate reductase
MGHPVSIAVHGASGRMGEAILRLAFARPLALRVVAAEVKRDSPLIGKRLRGDFGDAAGDLAYSASFDPAAKADVIVDFSTSQAFDDALAAAVAQRIAFVSGTTGLSSQQQAAMKSAARTIPILWSANFSIGVAVLTQLVHDAARALSDWDCEIVEAHHRHKKDAPSGTALALGRAVADVRGVRLDEAAVFDRTKTNAARDPSAIGFASVRAGDIVGEHTVLFAADGERIELVHRATDRDIFARGALQAAVWIGARAPGIYLLADVLER